MFARSILSMRFRRWIYTAGAIFVGAVTIGAWAEQSTGLFLQEGESVLFGYMFTWVAFLVSILIAPFALYDYVRWLFGTQSRIVTRATGIALPLLGFWAGLSWTGWDGCILEVDGSDYQVVACSEAGPMGLGLVVGLAVCLGFWLVVSKSPQADGNPPSDVSGLVGNAERG